MDALSLIKVGIGYLEKDITEGASQGFRACRGRPKRSWMDSITSWISHVISAEYYHLSEQQMTQISEYWQSVTQPTFEPQMVGREHIR